MLRKAGALTDKESRRGWVEGSPTPDFAPLQLLVMVTVAPRLCVWLCGARGEEKERENG